MSLKKEVFVLGGHGHGLENKISRTSKHNIDRIISKRRRVLSKQIILTELIK